ncbi:hypothetical protein [Leisingera aquaemixtae]|uniref:hypothetical protein n=1 Tax=Leisingera aquaemixtae TaxID=1396826 RepID=UPI0021A76686|nr:hypothetical protein [Leisingera aquaemixtae]UWQ46866.1 hypothetical protein K3719_05745 [Leisingera aquaemixtae]
MIFRFALATALALFLSSPAISHQVWCHHNCPVQRDTVDFFHKSKDVYVALTAIEQNWQSSSYSLENGILAEFDSKVDPSKSLNVEQYEKALAGYIELRALMDDLDEAIYVLQEADKKCGGTKSFNMAVERNLKDATDFHRLSTSGVRFSDAAGLSEANIAPMKSISDILSAWRVDLAILASTLDEVIVAMQDAMPLAEKGEFAAVMLSGRNAFGDKMPQFTDMLSAYQRFYVEAVLITINSTMQVYPDGLEWLTE